MKKWLNNGFRHFFQVRMRRILNYMEHPHEVQRSVLTQLLEATRHTEWGRKYDFRSIKTPEQFAARVPVQGYEQLQPFIFRMMHGEKDVLWSGQVKWFSKSSGTTDNKSKFIPVSSQNLKHCHLRGGWDTMTFFYEQRPDARQFERKSLLMGGSLYPFPPYPQTTIGDVSAIMIQHMPFSARPFFTPDFETALLTNFEEKIERMAQITGRERDLVMIGGVPTWTVVLFRRILEITGADNLLEIWPNLQGYIHGGVSFTPYRKQFQQFLPSATISYQEIYNASEGYFAAQNDFQTDDLLLLLENGIYYEFLPFEEWHSEQPVAIPLEEVEVGKDYALVISTNSGLWRYTPGDVITFTSKYPFKIKITGRMKQFVNAFGEEVMVENTDNALAATCSQMDAIVSEYTLAPIYFKDSDKGGHEWLVEFERMPSNMEAFCTLLDKNLRAVNSDYEAKRFKSMALKQLHLQPVPQGTFYNWLRSKGKYGGQHKVPRLANDRKYVDEILHFLEEKV